MTKTTTTAPESDRPYDGYLDYLKRFRRHSYDDIKEGEILHCAHHHFDVPVKVLSAETNTWVNIRPWLTAWIDAKSQKYAGWTIRAGTEEYPDGKAIEEALISAIENNNHKHPWLVYSSDVGKDYNNRIDDICSSLRIQHVDVLPYNARAKIVERSFRNIAREFEKLFPDNSDTVFDGTPTLDAFSQEFSSWYRKQMDTLKALDKTIGGHTAVTKVNTLSTDINMRQEIMDIVPIQLHIDIGKEGGDRTVISPRDFIDAIRHTVQENKDLTFRLTGEKVRYPDFEACIDFVEKHGLQPCSTAPETIPTTGAPK